MGILPSLQALKAAGKKAFAILIDPDEVSLEECAPLAERINHAGIDFVFVGGSLLLSDHFHQLVKNLKANLKVPVVLFPGNVHQISSDADALLFLSLISGRNPEMLIGQHVVAAPLLKRSNLEVIPTGYMLIESGKSTTVNYMSNTLPIPREKPDIAVCTAMAGELLGLRTIYMDAGSGADQTISTAMISAVAGAIDVPLIVGGGIRSTQQAEAVLKAGADLIVVGNAFEEDQQSPLISRIPELIATF
ncbi:UNVERIFIED_CONTAM: hypothetical protein GTU68_061132 [Idotea baltica]|nr:hypothetical protein [Idotea baltica]